MGGEGSRSLAALLPTSASFLTPENVQLTLPSPAGFWLLSLSGGRLWGLDKGQT